MSALAQINVSDFKKRVEEHVINTFGALIPQEQFEAMVNAEIKSFFEGTTKIEIEQVSSSYHSGRTESLKTAMTPFRAVVYAKILKMIGAQLDEFFKSDQAPVNKMLKELTEIPEMQEHQLSQAQRLMMAMAGTMFKSVMEQANYSSVQSIIQAFRNQNMWDIANVIEKGSPVYMTDRPEVKVPNV